jgi:hypothetical protein
LETFVFVIWAKTWFLGLAQCHFSQSNHPGQEQLMAKLGLACCSMAGAWAKHVFEFGISHILTIIQQAFAHSLTCGGWKLPC